MPRTLAWRGVLAGAYLPGQLDRKQGRCLKHLVDRDVAYPAPALCGRVNPDSLNDDDCAPTSSSTPCQHCIAKASRAGDAIPRDFA